MVICIYGYGFVFGNCNQAGGFLNSRHKKTRDLKTDSGFGIFLLSTHFSFNHYL